MFLGVSGIICSGKTTLTRFLGQRLNFQTLIEPEDGNSFLEDFYGDMRRFAFPSQLFFLRHRLKARDLLLTGKDVIQDRTIYEDALFARNLFELKAMDAREFGLYQEVYGVFESLVPKPDLIIYIDAPLDTVRSRLGLKPYMSALPPRYIENLYNLYQEWHQSYNLSATVSVSTPADDWSSDLSLIDRLLTNIEMLRRKGGPHDATQY